DRARTPRRAETGRLAGGVGRSRRAGAGAPGDLHRSARRRGRAQRRHHRARAPRDRFRHARRVTRAEAQDAGMKSRIVFFVVAVLAGIEVFHYLDSLNVVTSPVLAIPIAPPPAPARKNAPARRVVWVLIDGLRLDASRTMPTLARLRQEGADFEASADFPTYSIPNYVVQACGLDPATSGVRTNGYSMPVAFDSVFQ